MGDEKKKRAPKDAPLEEVDYEPEEEMGSAASAQAKLEKLREELKQVHKERQEYLDGWQRCKADAINERKETLEQAQRRAVRAVAAFAEEIIPALDSFDMASGSEAWEVIDPVWRSGMEHIRNQLLDVLQAHGIKRYGRIGELFDPKLHEAVQETDEMPGEPHSIVKILRYGYELNGQTMRAAQVVVKKG